MHHDTLTARRNASAMVKSVDNSRTSIVVFGARGRMGARIAALAHDDPAFDIRALIAREDAPNAGAGKASAPGASRAPSAPKSTKTAENTGVSAHVVIDFSSDSGALESLAIARRSNAALLV